MSRFKINPIGFYRLLLLMALLVQSASGQSVQPKKDLMNGNSRALIEDYEYFIEHLEAIHPDPYSAFGGEPGFKKRVDSLRFVLEKNENLDRDYQDCRCIAPD